MAEPSLDNLWCVKAILRGFDRASGLRVNFFKISLTGVNVDHPFLTFAREFLHCEITYLPFKYHGLPVGSNPRLESTWDPLVALLEKRLNLWKHKYVSMRIELFSLIWCLILFIFSSCSL